MASSLSNLVDNLVEGIHKIKCRHVHDNIKCELVELNLKFASAVLRNKR